MKPAVADLRSEAISGTTFAVHVTPGARTASLETANDGTIRIRVREIAEHGRATRSARGLLAEALDVAPTRLQLVRGATSRHKVFRLD